MAARGPQLRGCAFGMALALAAVAASWLLGAATPAAAAPAPEARWDTRREEIVVNLQFYDDGAADPADREYLEQAVLLSRGKPLDPGSFTLRETRGDQTREIAIDRVRPTGTDDTETLASNLLLWPAETDLDGEAVYRVAIESGAVVFLVDGEERNLARLSTDPMSQNDLVADLADVKLRSAPPRVRLDGGNAGGTLAAEFDWTVDRFGSGRWLNLEISGQAGINLQNSRRDDYYNNLEIDTRLFTADLVTFPGTSERRYTEGWLRSGFESDQRVKEVDWLVAIGGALYTKDPVSGWLLDRFGGETTHADISPLLILEYQYVHEVSESTSPGLDNRPDTDGAGDHRFRGVLAWSFPLSRDLDLTAIPALQGAFDVDLVLRAEAHYSVQENEFYDQTRIGLRLSPSGERVMQPSIGLWWERGEAPPVFEQFSAIMAGLGVRF